MSSNKSNPTVKWESLKRGDENGSRRSRTLRDEQSGTQLQGKRAYLDVDEDGVHVAEEDAVGTCTYLQIRALTPSGWLHYIIDTDRPGIAGIVGIGYGLTEPESWDMAREQARGGTGHRL
jgi:hypothetical protein